MLWMIPNEDASRTNLTIFMARFDRYGEQKIAQFRTHYLTKELAYVSTQPSGQVIMDTKMI